MEPRIKRTAKILRDLLRNLKYQILLSQIKFDRRPSPRIIYLDRHYPAPPASRSGLALGGSVKLTYLDERFPHGDRLGNIIYLVSGTYPKEATKSILRLQEKGFRVVLNQDGVNTRFSNNYAYKNNFQFANQHFRKIHTEADHVIYQSKFCERMSQRFLGKSPKQNSIIYNPTDLNSFKPAFRDRSNSNYPWKLFMIAAEESRRDRLQVGIQTLARVKEEIPSARIYIAGYDPNLEAHRSQMAWIRNKGQESGIDTRDIEFRLGRYTRQQAPSVLVEADILLHPAYMDPCPNLVVEALACGIPIVYSRSGGVPELVGNNAGIGISVPENWDDIQFPEPCQLAGAVVAIAADYERYSCAARSRADPELGLENFIERHYKIFASLLKSNPHNT